MNQDKKRRMRWWLYKGPQCIAKGLVYREGNVSVLWREDIGYTTQQASTVHTLLEMFPQANIFKREL